VSKVNPNYGEGPGRATKTSGRKSTRWSYKGTEGWLSREEEGLRAMAAARRPGALESAREALMGLDATRQGLK
jgi:hypothetical protein